MAALDILTGVTVLMLVGIFLTLISYKLNISNVLFLLIGGLILGFVNDTYGFLDISPMALLTVAIISLIIIVFDGSSKFKSRSMDELSVKNLKLISLFIFFNLLIFPLVLSFLFYDGFSATVLVYGFIFSIIMAATDPATLFVMLKNKTSKIVDSLEIEAILNTPLTVLIPLIVLDALELELNLGLVTDFFTQFLTQILVGVGSGVVVGLIVMRAMRSYYNEELNPFALISSAFLAYVLAENLEGSGVLAVAVLGFLFGKSIITQKKRLQDFNGMISYSLEILVFLLLGFIVSIELTPLFILKSLLVFALLIVTRYLSVNFVYGKTFGDKERLFLTLVMPKGIATAVLLFTLSLAGIPGLGVVIDLTILVMIYSLILTTIASFNAEKLIGVKI